MAIVLLTGPSASGKSTIAPLVARKRAKCAVIDVDVVRGMYQQPHLAPWEGGEGRAQQELGIRHACMLAESFAVENVDVLILDVVTNETAVTYKRLCPTANVVLLLPSLEELRRRFSLRPPTITEAEFAMVFEWQIQLNAYNVRLDNSEMSAEEVAESIHLLFRPRPSLGPSQSAPTGA